MRALFTIVQTGKISSKPSSAGETNSLAAFPLQSRRVLDLRVAKPDSNSSKIFRTDVRYAVLSTTNDRQFVLVTRIRSAE